MAAVAIIAPNVPDAEGQVCTLSDIRSLPGAVRGFIQRRFPTFRLKYSRTAQCEYYANTCPKCGVLSGDFYLHSEPGGPFFPTTENEASQLTIENIPLDGPVEIEAAFGAGTADLILKHGEKRIAEEADWGA